MAASSGGGAGQTLWPAPHLTGPVEAEISVPGSKSLTNRYLVLAALADGPSIIRGPLRSRDTALMIDALQNLGAAVEELSGETGTAGDLRVSPLQTGAGDPMQRTIDCGLAGTVMRFVPPLAALVAGTTLFDGDPHARRRPMGSIVTALRGLGVGVDDAGTGSLPFSIHGDGRVQGGRLVIDASASSQFVSALLLVGARFVDGLHLEHVGEPVPSLDHIRMTVDVLRSVGVSVDDSVPDHWQVHPGTIRSFDLTVEADLSNAGPFLAAAVVTGGCVRVRNWPSATTQVGDRWRSILPLMGASVRLDGDLLTVSGGPAPTGGTFADTSELAPTVAALCALATTPSTLTGIAHLRGHETDRLAALVAEINGLGGDAEETADGLLIRPAPLHGGVFRTYDDHRMATAGAILGLAVDGVEVQNIGTTAKTMPDFPEQWAALVRTAASAAAAKNSAQAPASSVGPVRTP